MLLVLLTLPVNAGPFTDLPGRDYDQIDKLQSEGFIEGFPDGTFRGNRAVTRYEMVMIMTRIVDRLLSDLSYIDPPVKEVMESQATAPTEMAFTDIPADHWAREPVKALENCGLLIGYPGGKFDGNRGITRNELMVMLNRLWERLPEWFGEDRIDSATNDTAAVFSDMPASHWAYKDFVSMAKLGTVWGYPDGTFKGDRLFTRWEMAMVIARIWDRLASEECEEAEREKSTGA